MDAAERRALVVGRVVEELGRLVEELQITNEEWYAALDFLTAVGRHDEFILLSDVNRLSVLVDQVTHQGEEGDGATPSNVLGPFWKDGAPLLESPARICREDEPGEPFLLAGQVRSTAGAPLAGAILDVWQTAANRLYENQDDAQPEMNLRGRVRVDAEGRYEVRSVVPVPYEIPTDGPVGTFLRSFGRHAWRPAHLHVRALAPGHRTLTTMLYMAEDPWLADDAIGSVRDSLVLGLERGEDGVARGRYDFVLATA